MALAQNRLATSTNLIVTSGGVAVTSIESGGVITLSASVHGGSANLTTGQVNFCDATASRCTDIHLLGTAQLTSAGTAILKLRPGIGNRSFIAVFPGTNQYAPSTSGASTLKVTGTAGTFASTTTLAEAGGWGSYSLTATVTEMGGTFSPTGKISFLDTSNRNSVLAKVPLGAGTANVGWPTPQTLTTTADCRTIAVGDFNGDGILDIIAAGAGPAQPLLVWLGNPNGTYTAAPPPVFSGYSLVRMLVSDFNGDGKLDLAILNGDNNTVSILLGKGDGTFTATSTSPAIGSNPGQFVAGDFNGDGIPDLAVTSQSSTPLQILLGKGDGTFAPAFVISNTGSTSPYFLAVGDFNGDGRLDLAASDLYSDSVSVLLGKGDGTFAAAATIHSGSGGSPVASADLNGDGKLDLAFGVPGPSGAGDSAIVLTGNGSGTFSSPPPVQPAQSHTISWIQSGDFNGDGVADLVLMDSASGIVSVFLGAQSGVMSSPTTFNMTGIYFNTTSAVVADVDGDGRADLVIGAANGDDQVSVYLTRPTQTATAAATITLPVSGAHQVAASYPGDGHYLASTSGTKALWGVPPATATTLSVTSAGAQVTSVAYGSVVTLTASVAAGTSRVTAGQVNFCDASARYCTDIHLLGTAQLTSNGIATLSFVPGAGQHSYKAIFLESGAGAGSLSNVVTLVVAAAPAPVYTDATSLSETGQPGDYSLTATVIGAGGSAPPTGSISFVDTSNANTQLASAHLGAAIPGVGWRISQTPAINQSPIGEVVADFNGDGILDLALLWANGTYNEGPYSVTTLLGKGDGTYITGPTLQALDAQMTEPSFIVGDFNGDGKPDIAILSSNTILESDYVTVLAGNGNGSFAAPQTSLAYSEGVVGGDFIHGALVAADFNGDGKLDVAVVGDYVLGGVTVILGNGDGTFKSAGPNLEVSKTYGLIATGDFNGDHIPDLVATQYFGPGGATVFLGKGDGTFTTGSFLPVDEFPSAIVVGDFNQDGVLDLAFGYEGAAAVYLGKGDGTFTQGPNSPIIGAGQSLVAGDFNLDGKLDLAGIDNYYDQIDLFTGAGDGTFTKSVTTPNVSDVFVGPFAIVAADFNGDGTPDLAMLTTNVSTASILLSEPTEIATATVTGLAPIGTQTHIVEAHYLGDSTYPPSISGTVTLFPGMAPVRFSPAGGTYPAPQTITLSESIPGATIYYSVSGALNTNGLMQYTSPISLPVAGRVEIQAYATGTGYGMSEIAVADFTLTPAGTAPANVSLTPSASAITDQQSVSIAVTVSGSSGQAVPTGSLSLIVGTFTTQVELKDGAVTLNIPSSAFRAGANSVTVTYSGDMVYSMEKATTTITVSPVVISPPSPLSISAGGSATAKLALSAGSTYSGTLHLTCAMTSSPAAAQNLPTCSLNPTSVAIAPKGTGSATFTVQTIGTSPTASLDIDVFGGSLRWIGGAALAGVILLGLPDRRRRRLWMISLVAIAGATGLFGCGGSTTSPTVSSTPQTTAGNYAFSVTATDASNAEITVVTVQVSVQ